MSDYCKSCGTLWSDHLGITGTCSKLVCAQEALRVIRTWAACPRFENPVNEFNDIVKLCDKTLEQIE